VSSKYLIWRARKDLTFFLEPERETTTTISCNIAEEYDDLSATFHQQDRIQTSWTGLLLNSHDPPSF
jgi:hypothetical protein